MKVGVVLQIWPDRWVMIFESPFRTSAELLDSQMFIVQHPFFLPRLSPEGLMLSRDHILLAVDGSEG